MAEDRWGVPAFVRQLDAIEADAKALADGLSEADGTRRLAPESWSVAECLAHLAVSKHVYLAAMRKAPRGKATNDRSVRPGWFGRFMAWGLEPPPRKAFRAKAPAAINPAIPASFHDAFNDFLAAHAEVKRFLLEETAGTDLNGRFPNPFVPSLRLSLASGLQVIAAHDRRHLWQAWRSRRAAQ